MYQVYTLLGEKSVPNWLKAFDISITVTLNDQKPMCFMTLLLLLLFIVIDCSSYVCIPTSLPALLSLPLTGNLLL